MKFKLLKKDFEFIIKIIESLPKSLNYIKNDDFYVVFEADDKTVEDLLDKLSDVLSEKGFDENDNLNAIGVRIEKIIDPISDVFYN
ncbi:MAG: hypothetical protein AAF489_08770 [Bacteroidota bacterium]